VNDVQFTWNGCEWNTIPSFSKYAASKCGKIARIVAHKTKKDVPYLKSQFLDAYGYFIVGIDDKNAKVHRLVCEAWNGQNAGDCIYCCHLDGDKRNNNASNLVWGNSITRTAILNANSPKIKLDIQKARHIRAAFSDQGEQCIKGLAELFCVAESTVVSVIKGVTWKECGE